MRNETDGVCWLERRTEERRPTGRVPMIRIYMANVGGIPRQLEFYFPKAARDFMRVDIGAKLRIGVEAETKTLLIHVSDDPRALTLSTNGSVRFSISAKDVAYWATLIGAAVLLPEKRGEYFTARLFSWGATQPPIDFTDANDEPQKEISRRDRTRREAFADSFF